MNVVDYNNAIDIAKAINRYIKIKDWAASTAYIVGQYVNNDGVLYKCTTANNDATFDPTNWQKVAGGGLDEWEPSTLYSVDDVVIYNNKIYQCNTAHTSGATFLPDEAKWTEISACITRIPNWVANEDYVVGDLVAHDAKIYRCTTAHTSGSTFDSTEEAKWEELSPTINEISLWASATDYEVGQLVIYSNKLFRCTTAHTSTSSFNSDINNWQEISSNDIDSWQASMPYKIGDFVYKDGQIYRCTNAHTSDSSNFYVDITNWELLDTKWRAENWTTSKYYVVGDVVLYDNRLFKCITANTSSSDFATDYDKWSAISSKLELWKTNTYYAVGDLVIYNNKLYRCKTRHTSTTTLSADIANWDLISSGGIDNWKSNEDYYVNNVVIYNNKIYQCKTAHSAGSTFDYSKWKEISSSDIDLWASNFDYIVGDIVIYDNQLYRCITTHTSTSNFNDTISRWQILDTKWQAKDWATGTYYLDGEVVLYDNTPYKCITSHTSLGTFELDKDDWEPLSSNIRQWTSGTTYKIGDTVIYENELWRCNTDTTSNGFEKDKWDKIDKCNIEIWHGAPDSDILALLHFDNSADLYYNEYGNPFTGNPKCSQTSALFGGCNYSLKVGDSGELISPTYSFPTGNEVYTLEYWFRNELHWNMFDKTIMMPFFDGYSATAYTSGLCAIKNPQGSQIGTFNEWQTIHIAQVITGTESTVYLDGVSLGTVTRANANADISFYIGYSQNFTKATLDELRISAIAKYTSNFTPTREIFPNPNYEGYKYNDLVVYKDKIYRALEDNNDIEFNYSKWIEVSKSEIPYWTSGSNYSTNEVVLYGKSLYRATTNIVNSTVNPAQSSDFQLLDITVIHEYAGGENYQQDEVVRHNDNLYLAISQILNSPNVFDSSQWIRLNIPSIDNWEPNTGYKVGNIVVNNNQIYICTTAHTSDSTSFNTDIANWGVLDTKWKSENWSANTLYTANEVVLYDNRLFRCVSTHTSAVDFATDANYWLAIGAKLEAWKQNVHYKVEDVIINNNKLYRCITEHTSTTTFDGTKWNEISPATIELWQTSTDYKVGDIVVKDNQLFRCKTAHISDSSDFSVDVAKWDLLDTKWLAKSWVASTLYFADEVVLYDSTLYKCITTHTSLGTFELDKADWEKLNASIREWVSGNTYKVGDIVIYNGDIWKCVTSNNSPSFEKSKWVQVNKCNIERWHGAPNNDILALLHFDNPNDLYYNEYGDRFTTGGRLYYAYASGKFGGCAYSTSSYNTTYGITSPSYTYSSNSDVYTIEFWFMIGDHSYSALYDIWGSPGRGIDTHTWPASFFYGTSYQTSSGFGNWSWNHIAYVLTYDTVELYVNGTLLNTVPRTAGEAVGFNTVGSGGNWREQFYFDDFRVTKGRVYNGNFTPPTEPFQDPNYEGYKKDDLVVYEDKIYRALVTNNDIQFDKSKWIEVSPCVGIEEWASGNDYISGDVIIYNNNLYKVVNDVTSATVTPDNSNDYVLLGGDSIKTWEGSKEYHAGTIVLHQNRLYRNANNIPSSVTTFSRNDWTPLSPVLEDWTSSKEYKVGDFVIRNDILYECITDNNDATFNSAKWKPISKEGINAWQSNKQYALYDLVVEDEELYMCISPHTSSSDFQTDLDANKWKLIGGGGGSGGDWNQVTKMNVVAPLDVDINIPYTNTFKRPPVEVLKYEQGTTDITTNVLNFGVGDGSKFEIDGITAKDSPLITFDGVAKPNHDILYSFGTPTQMVDKYYSESEEIDLDDFKVVGEVSLE